MRHALAPLVAVVIAVALLGAERAARAQACCSGGGALAPSRLEHHEGWLAGARLAGNLSLGDFDAGADYRGAADGTRDVAAELQLFAALRVVERVQLGVVAPLLLNDRQAGGTSATGVGLGDVAVSARWDALYSGEHVAWPGIALELGLIAPTGTSAEAATRPLAVDATGEGRWQLELALGLEHVFGARREWLASLRGGGRWRAPHAVYDRQSTRALEGRVTAGLAWQTRSELTLAVSADVTFEGRGALDGVDVPGSAHQLVTFALTAATPFGEHWRGLLSLSGTPPADDLGRNHSARVGLALTLLHSGW